jgi:predicted O-methyltransferase YrrM
MVKKSRYNVFLVKIWFFTTRPLMALGILCRIIVHGILHPRFLFDFLCQIIFLIAEFRRKLPGRIKNFRESKLCQEIERHPSLSKSNYFNFNPGNIRPTEAQVMAGLIEHLKPQALFEFGTFNGFSTLHMAQNSPEDAKVYTLDLPPNYDAHDFKHDIGEAYWDITTIGLNNKRWFHNDPCRPKIVELLGDSMTFDCSPYYGKIDFVFIDANHSYAYVLKDTENAFKMLTPRGVILWHDYEYSHRGIVKILGDLALTRKIYYIEQTRYAVFINNE